MLYWLPLQVRCAFWPAYAWWAPLWFPAPSAHRNRPRIASREFLACAGVAPRPGLVKSDPTVGVSNPPRKRTDGFIPWTEEHAAAYEARWPIDTRQRVWLDILLFTGLRRGDAVRLGRQQCSRWFYQNRKERLHPGGSGAQCSKQHSMSDPAAISPSSLAGMADLSPRRASATCSRMRARPQACLDQRTVFASSRRQARPKRS